MTRIAADIKEQCGGKLHAVVATHRHKDHISGFATAKNGKASGDIIRSCSPDVVIQPWTEDPKAATDATRATQTSVSTSKSAKGLVASLSNMQTVSGAMLTEAKRMSSSLGLGLQKQLAFIGDDNLSNLSAVQNLMTMGKKNYYVNFGSKSGLETILPGVKIHVLGPPTIDQSDKIKKQRSTDANEFWKLQAAAGNHVAAASKLFPHARVYRGSSIPQYARWFLPRAQKIRGDQMLELVRILDTAMNNTSVILLFEVGGKKLLFPGDAQIENWSFALSKPECQKLLADVDLYKVGHHGSLNATPKSLWALFKNRSKTASPKRLQSVVSTMAGKHGTVSSGTEVPRSKLVDALKAESTYYTTQDLKGSKVIRKDFTIEF